MTRCYVPFLAGPGSRGLRRHPSGPATYLAPKRICGQLHPMTAGPLGQRDSGHVQVRLGNLEAK